MFAQYTEIYLWNFSMWSFVSELVQSLVSGKLFKVHFVIVHLLSYLLCLDLSPYVPPTLLLLFPFVPPFFGVWC
jgi:hypothetical protein